MSDWPTIVDVATRCMESGVALSQLPNPRPGAVDERLSACFEAFCLVMGNLHRAKIIENFAGAVFYLCYLLRVCIHFCSTSSGFK
jgi:hypothetical protein